MSNAETDKAKAKSEQMKAKLDVLKAQMKEASADARIAIKQKINELEANL
jgi:hypothetical protein